MLTDTTLSPQGELLWRSRAALDLALSTGTKTSDRVRTGSINPLSSMQGALPWKLRPVLDLVPSTGTNRYFPHRPLAWFIKAWRCKRTEPSSFAYVRLFTKWSPDFVPMLPLRRHTPKTMYVHMHHVHSCGSRLWSRLVVPLPDAPHAGRDEGQRDVR